MAACLLIPSSRVLAQSSSRVAGAARLITTRHFSQSQRLLQTAPTVTVRKPVGAFRGTLFGFLLGSTLAGSAMYYYVLDEYRVSNELLTEDVYNLHAAVQRTEGYIKALEDRIASDEGKKE